VEAYLWFTLATDGGTQDNGKVQADLRNVMTPEQVREAQSRRSAWRPRSSIPNVGDASWFASDSTLVNRTLD
jgi:hypothetical protein